MFGGVADIDVADQQVAPVSHDVVISIINYRTPEITLRCVRSVLHDLLRTPELDGQVVVVDNDSGDRSVERLSAGFAAFEAGDRVTLVCSSSNSGFAGGHNQAMREHEAEFYLILNSDAELRPGCLRALLDAASARPDAGLLAPRLEWEDGTTQISAFRFPTVWSEVIRGAGTRQVTSILSRFDVPLGLSPDPASVEWVSFAAVLLRAEMVHSVGLMDEGYFLYFEDIDYCWRARQDGWPIALVPRARVTHHRSGSGPVARTSGHDRLPAYYYAARSRFFGKKLGRGGPLAANLGWLFGRLAASSRPLLGRRIPAAYRAEVRDIWTNCLTPFGDRHAPEQ